MSASYSIQSMQRSHWARVRNIYGEGLATGLAAFMTTPPSWKDWDAVRLPFGRLVACRHEKMLGWAALTRAADT